MAQVVERNIQALLQRQQAEEKQKTWQDRTADAVTKFTGSMTFVLIHLVLFTGWILWNVGWLGLKPFDPSLVILAMEASVEAIFLSTFVLISQNRMAALADKRADLNLQVSLLSEHEITRLVILVREIARKMDVQEAQDPEIPELAQDVHPERVLDTIEKFQQKAEQGQQGQ
ncbi:putative membrane protein [Hymenobacter chitinivorans DSM 11115]|uniref:Putative membrane protein n=2 Tax=Hymenobacter chitinivorans TaxID=89969 RepID=A0A2M9AQ32_9BACT|nr:putative membrane protein [Hymenobacter chitinivorans DSM 11115]